MSAEVQEILHSFDRLPESDKRVLATEILRRSLLLDAPPLSDDELVAAADDVFLNFDLREATDG